MTEAKMIKCELCSPGVLNAPETLTLQPSGYHLCPAHVTSVADIPSDKKRGAMYVCQCLCGQVKEVRASDLRRGDIRSCGCLAREVRSAWMKALTNRQKEERGKRLDA